MHLRVSTPILQQAKKKTPSCFGKRPCRPSTGGFNFLKQGYAARRGRQPLRAGWRVQCVSERGRCEGGWTKKLRILLVTFENFVYLCQQITDN